MNQYTDSDVSAFVPETMMDMGHGEKLYPSQPITKREYFAANSCPPLGEISVLTAEILNGTKQPINSDIDRLKWWLKAQQKYAVLKADLLIEALNEKQI